MEQQYYDQIEKYAKLYAGSEDIYRNTLFTNDKMFLQHKLENIEQKYNRTDKMKLLGHVVATKFRFKLPKINANQVYKNLKLFGDIEIGNVELEIGGSSIERIYGNVFDVLRSIYGISDENTLPFSFCRDSHYSNEPNLFSTKETGCYLSNLENMDIVIYIETKEKVNIDDFNITLDIFDLCYNKDPTYFESLEPLEYVIIQNVHIQEHINNNTNIYKLCFNHVCAHIILHCPNNTIKNISLLLDDNILKITPLKVFDANSGKYIIPLTLSFKQICKYGINLGQVDKCSLKIEFEEINNECDNIVDIYGVCIHIARVMSGMIGLAFSK